MADTQLKSLLIIIITLLNIFPALTSSCSLYPDYNCNISSVIDSKNFYKFTIEEALIAPDNYLQKGKVINGQFPGPTIEVFPNERLVVEVVNKLSVPVTLHWHGIDQRRTADADGVPQVTQYSIQPSKSFTYVMDIGDKPGTFIYHAHTQMDIAWVHGALIVKDFPDIYKSYPPQYQYDHEEIIILQQIYHTPIDEVYQRIISGGFVPLPISNAINGHSYGIWPTSNAHSKGYSIIKVKKGKTYRFRIMNLSTDSLFRFEIKFHRMTVIEMDGILCDPVDTDHVDIHNGQRYSVIIKMDQPLGNYLAWSHSVPGPGPENGLAILHYTGAKDPTPLRTLVKNGMHKYIVNEWITPYLNPNWRLNQSELYPLPRHVDKRIFIDFQIVTLPKGKFRFAMDGHIFTQPDIPYLHQVREGINITEIPHVFEIIEGQHVEIVFQNRLLGPVCIAHPWHTHGHNFWVIASGPDEFKGWRDDPEIEKRVSDYYKGNFQFRDTFIQYPLQSFKNTKEGAGCGWYAVRFIANNPGVWVSHCHITRHMVEGKMFVIWEHSEDNHRLTDEY